MTALRQRMLEDLRLRGYADRTVEAYITAVARLAQFHHAPPDQLSEEQLRAYLLCLTTEREEPAGGAGARRSVARARRGPDAGLSRLSDDDLRVRTPAVGRDSAPRAPRR